MRTRSVFLLWLLVCVLAPFQGRAESFTVSQYARLAATLPWAVALEKGMFKEAGLAIDDITPSPGGGTSVRNMLAGTLPFAEIATPAAIAAIRAGMDLVIVMACSNHIGELTWAALPNSNITSIKDLVGKKVAFTAPKSATEMIIRYALEREGLTGKVEIASLGSLGAGLTALSHGAVAAAPWNDPEMTVRPDKYRILFNGFDYYPKFTWAVGVTTREFAQRNPKTVRSLAQVRRRAVDFVYTNRAEAAQIYAKVWGVDLKEAEALLPKYYDWQHWSRGDLSKEGLETVIRGLTTVGDLEGPFDWSKVIDQSFLDEDLRRPL
jgi:NitT/TauT family transport system substrate-binding protein